MMKHPEETTLHLHIDGELPTGERWHVEAHLRECPSCLERAEEIRTLVGRMGDLEQEIQPPVDLWQGIAARIGGEGARAEGSVAALPLAARPSRRRIYLRGGWITAIAATLALGIGLGRMAPRPGDEGAVAVAPTQLPAATAEAPAAVRESEETVALLATAHEAPAYDSAIADLETVLEASGDQLRPETVTIIEENLAIIDQAIAEAQEALLADPANELLHQHIAENKQKKLGLLRTMATAVNAEI